MAACGVVSLCYGDMSLSSASGVAMSFGKISDVVRGKKSEHGLENPKEIDKIRDAVLEAYNAKFDLERDTELKLYVEAADTALAEHLVACSLSHKEIVDAMATVRIDDERQEAHANFSQVATDLIMDRLAIAAPQHFDKAKAKSEPYHYARNVVQIGVNAALTQIGYFKHIEPQAIARLLGGLAEVAHEQKEQGKVLGEIAGGVEKGFKALNDRLDQFAAQMVEKGLASRDTPHEQLFAELAEQFDSPLNELMGVIGGVLTNIKNPDNFGQLLQMALTALKVSREEYHRLSSLGNEIAAEGFEVEGIDELLKQADRALNDPDIVDLTTARAKLREARKRYDTSVQKRYQQQQENTARMLVAEAKLAQASSDVDEAVELYDEAMEKVEHDNDLMRDYLWDKGEMLSDAGSVSPEPEFLQSSIQTWKQLLNICDRKSNPDYWANVQGSLGNALWQLGLRQSDDGLLKEAIDAYRAALQERMRDRVPFYWAATQNNLGFALWQLGLRQSECGLLKEAIDAFRAALQEFTRDRVPFDWATTQNNLGNALQTLGFMQSDQSFIQDAIRAYELSLEERREDNAPFYHNRSKHNLEIAKQVLADLEAGKSSGGE